MEPPTQIFRQYDIRGIVGEDLLPASARAVGRAYGTALREVRDGGGGEPPRLVAVGADNRPSSPGLCDALATGLTEAGVDVLDLGTVPTPVTYWAEYRLGTDGAIQITGSHNPPEWNGIKMTMGRRPYFGEDIAALRGADRGGDACPGEGQTRAGRGARRLRRGHLAAIPDIPAHPNRRRRGEWNGLLGGREAPPGDRRRCGAPLLRLGRHLPESPPRSCRRGEPCRSGACGPGGGSRCGDRI